MMCSMRASLDVTSCWYILLPLHKTTSIIKETRMSAQGNPRISVKFAKEIP